MLACTKEDVDIVVLLVSAGASVHYSNKDGWSSLHLACRQGSLPIVRYLVSIDANLTKTISKNGRTPLHTAGDALLVMKSNNIYSKNHFWVSSFVPIQLIMVIWKLCAFSSTVSIVLSSFKTIAERSLLWTLFEATMSTWHAIFSTSTRTNLQYVTASENQPFT